MLLRGLAIFSLACITAVLATTHGCRLVVYTEEDYKGLHETILDIKEVKIEIKSFHVHGHCKWSMDKIVRDTK